MVLNQARLSIPGRPMPPFLLRAASTAQAEKEVLLHVVSFLGEPFGADPTDREYKQFYGMLQAFPAVVIFLTGLSFPKRNESNQESSADG